MSGPGPSGGPDPVRKYFVNFNQDSSSLQIGCQDGYRLLGLEKIDNLREIYRHENEDTKMVERLFSSSLVAVVAVSSPRKLKVCHFKKGTEICNYSYSNTILSVKLNRQRLVVCLEESLYIHNIRDMKVVHTIRDTPPNPQGLCALSTNQEYCFLAYPGSLTVGEVQIFDTVNLHARTMIAAHASPLAALAFCCNGSRIATASEKGTVIRVFSSMDGTSLYEFRRGVKRCVTISSLAFSTCGQFLCSSSNTETVHIFKLEDQASNKSEEDEASGSWMGYLTNYLPTQVAGVFTQFRAFAYVTLPFCNLKNVISMPTVEGQPRLLVATENGELFIYNFTTAEGSELSLYKKVELWTGPIPDNQVDGAAAAGAAGSASPAVTSPPHAEPINIPSRSSCNGSALLGSYAGIVKGNPPGLMSGTESDKMREMVAATESPPKSAFQFSNDQEYPPLTQNTD